jgi:type VI secretion system secreted protein VgrG
VALKQASRLLTLQTPLGDDVLVLTGFSGREELSRLFHYELQMLSHNASISASQIVGKNVTFGVKMADDSPRYFNGFVRRFFAGDEDRQTRRSYRAEVVPWLWFLTRTTDHRIFQNKSVPEIIEQIFKDLGFSDYTISQIKGQHPKWEYCVQYRETDFAFVSRLMEEEGIFYFFKHESGKHTLVMADQKGAYTDLKESEVNYPRDFGAVAMHDHITRWEHGYEFRSGKWAQTDYNFEDHPARNEPTPAKLLMTDQTSTVKLDNIEKYELYDYPGGYEKKDDGQADAKIRMEADEVEYEVVRADSKCRSFTPGGKFKIKDHLSKSEQGKQYVITGIEHSASEPGVYETDEKPEEDYKNTFTCVPAAVTFRPARITPKPMIHGSQTAVVVGPKGEEIWPDKYGRVKVQFFWDREGKRDEKSSCWVRCVQSSAGKGWGSMFIPRIGQEVVVSYLEGDPDRPLITGLVYNADQMPAYKLPDEKTKSYLKTNSTKGGQGYNEIRFDDAQGKEQIYIHGQHDFDLHVQNDRKEKIAGEQSLTVGGSQQEKIGSNHLVDAGEEIHLKAGTTVVIEAGVQLTLMASGSFVDIGPAGVSIQGTTVLINSGGTPGQGSPSSPAVPQDSQSGQKSAPD